MRKITSLLVLLLSLCSVAFAADNELRVAAIPTYREGAWAANGAISTLAIQSATDALEQVFTAPESATPTKICIFYGARTGTPPTYKIGFQGVNTTTGRANGTYLTGTGECSATFTPPASAAWDSTNQCFTLTGTTCSLTRGTQYSMVLSYSSGTVSGVNNSSISLHFNNAVSPGSANEYLWKVVSGAATADTGFTPIAMFYGDGSSRYWGNATKGYIQNTITGTTEYALAFNVPCPTGQTYKLDGMRVQVGANPGAGTSFVGTFYTGTSSLASATLDSDLLAGYAGDPSWMTFLLSSPQVFTCNTLYRFGVTLGSGSKSWPVVSVGSSAYLDAFPLGVNTYGSHRASGGATAWTDDTTQRPVAELLLSTIVSAGGGGSGVMRQGDMMGGFSQ